MGCMPTLRPLALTVAVVTPPLVLRLPLPSLVAPSLKVTLPVGAPALGGAAATVAVKVTVWPAVAGFAAEVSLAVTAALLTVCVTGEAALLVVKLESPLYAAVRLW